MEKSAVGATGGYRVLNPPKPDEVAASGIFVYVLLLDAAAGTHPHPFYVGQAVDLKRHLNNHPAIRWHGAAFGRNVKVWIAGKVAEGAVAAAEYDLAQLFAAEGYQVSGRDAAWGPGLAGKSVAEVFAYAQQAVGERKALAAWRAHWLSAARPTAAANPAREDLRLTRSNLIEAVADMRDRLREGTRGSNRWATYDLVARLAREYSDQTRSVSAVLSASDIATLSRASAGGGFYLVWWPTGGKPKVPGAYSFKLRRSFATEFASRLKASRKSRAAKQAREAAAGAKRSAAKKEGASR